MINELIILIYIAVMHLESIHLSCNYAYKDVEENATLGGMLLTIYCIKFWFCFRFYNLVTDMV